jgi:hypothetical protein
MIRDLQNRVPPFTVVRGLAVEMCPEDERHLFLDVGSDAIISRPSSVSCGRRCVCDGPFASAFPGINGTYYNFCRVHGLLRITPAMAAGVTDHVWKLDELLAAI